MLEQLPPLPRLSPVNMIAATQIHHRHQQRHQRVPVPRSFALLPSSIRKCFIFVISFVLVEMTSHSCCYVSSFSLPSSSFSTSSSSTVFAVDQRNRLHHHDAPSFSRHVHQQRSQQSQRSQRKQQRRRFKLEHLYSSAPSFDDDSSTSPSTAAVSTIRIPLTRIFNGEREYLFTIRRNVRSYEWTYAELEDLFDSIISLRSTEELELNAITILPTTPPPGIGTASKLGRRSQFYDVHDGQQRLVSLSLLLAALRDYLWMYSTTNKYKNNNIDEFANDDEFPRAGADDEDDDDYQEDAMEVARTIFPTKSRHNDVVRVQLREKQTQWLNLILSHDGRKTMMTSTNSTPMRRKNDIDVDDENHGDDENQYQELQSLFPPLKKRKSMLSDADMRIIEGYEYFLQQISLLGPKKALDVLLDNFMNGVYVMVCIPANTKIARNIVMGMSKGKNLEPVDEFKSMICFGYVSDENRQDLLLEEWNALVERVGRKNVETSCIIISQIHLRRRGGIIRKHGEVDLVEKFLKEFYESSVGMTRKQQEQENGTKETDVGVFIFHEMIVPYAETLYGLQNQQIQQQDDTILLRSLLEYESDGMALKKSKLSSDQQRHQPRRRQQHNYNHHVPSLTFLHASCNSISTVKEIEMVLLYLVTLWQKVVNQSYTVPTTKTSSSSSTGRTKHESSALTSSFSLSSLLTTRTTKTNTILSSTSSSSSSSSLDVVIPKCLKKLEAITLWMMMTTPKKRDRLERCFAIMDYFDECYLLNGTNQKEDGTDIDIVSIRQPRSSSSSSSSSSSVHNDVDTNDIEKSSSSSSSLFSPLELTDDEQQYIINTLRTSDMASTSKGTTIVKLVLERLNEYQLVQQSQGRITPMKRSQLQLEHVLPQKYYKNKDWMEQWKQYNNNINIYDKELNDNENDSSSKSTTRTTTKTSTTTSLNAADEYVHKLGNLVLLNQKMNGSIQNYSFDIKREYLETSPYPLTRQVTKYKEWNPTSISRQHNELISLICHVWNLS